MDTLPTNNNSQRPAGSTAGPRPTESSRRTEHDEHAAHHGHAEHAEHAGPGEHAEHDGHEGHGGHGDHVAQFRRLFWVMLALALPVVASSGMFAMILGYRLPDAGWVVWVSPVLGTVMYVWGGRPFLTGAVSEVRSRRPGMMLLIALAITVAFVASWGANLGLLAHELDFWWELALLIVIMLLGHWIEMRSLAETSSALESLAALLPDEAERVEGNDVVTVSPSELRLTDVVVVRPGGRVPADGEVTEGSADVDESMITGESRPVRRTVGDRVVAGTVATDSALRVRVTAVAWSVLGSPDDAIIRTITVLVIACPHALGLAIPLVVSIATERAAKAGVLVKDRLALESMRTVDSVLFDKTGTLTRGEPVVSMVATRDITEHGLLKLAAAVEMDSEHPLAKAIVTAARDRSVPVPRATGFRASPALGVTGIVDGRTVSVGGPGMLAAHSAGPLGETAAWGQSGAIILHVLVDGQVVGALGLTDEIRPESRDAVDALHDLGISVAMITGDAQQVADAVGADLGIDRIFAGVRPEDKAAKVAELQREGRRVAMVGDGVNDAPALARADVGIAIGAGTDVAIASAGVILASDDPRSVLSVIELSRASYRKMTQNLWWAAGYNLISVPLAAGVLAPVGFVLPMAVGALLMSVSTIVVALNAQLLRRVDLSAAALSRSA